MSKAQLSETIKNIIRYGKESAIDSASEKLGTEHILHSMLSKKVHNIVKLLDELNVDYYELNIKLEKEFFRKKHVRLAVNLNNIELTRQAEKALKTTFLEKKLLKSPHVNSIHLLLCILRNENDDITKFFNKNNIDYKLVKDKYLELQEMFDKNEHEEIIETPPVLETSSELNFQIKSIKDIKRIELSEQFFSKPLSYISLYFNMDEYSTDEIAEILSFFSDLYREESGEGLIIKGQDIFEVECVLEPVEI